MGERHYNTITKQAKILVAVLDQELSDNGTAAELVWTAAHNISVIGYHTDLRESAGRGELQYNLMIGAAIRRSGDTTVSSLNEVE